MFGVTGRRNLSGRDGASLRLKAVSAPLILIAIAALWQIPRLWIPGYLAGRDYYFYPAIACLAGILIWQILVLGTFKKILLLAGFDAILCGILLFSISIPAKFEAKNPAPPAAEVSEPAAPPPPPAPAAPPKAAAAAPKKLPPAAPYLPEFPWPPPKSSAFYVMPTTFLHGPKTFGNAAQTLIGGLEKAGYTERSFFSIENGGIALVTRLEKIGDDGAPAAKASRWPGALRPIDYRYNSGVDAILRGLFEAPAGRYRIVVFLLAPIPPAQPKKEVAGEEAAEWLASGANTLPKYVAAQPFDDIVIQALIYEFESAGQRVKAVESQLPGQVHLTKSGLLAALKAS